MNIFKEFNSNYENFTLRRLEDEEEVNEFELNLFGDFNYDDFAIFGRNNSWHLYQNNKSYPNPDIYTKHCAYDNIIENENENVEFEKTGTNYKIPEEPLNPYLWNKNMDYIDDELHPFISSNEHKSACLHLNINENSESNSNKSVYKDQTITPEESTKVPKKRGPRKQKYFRWSKEDDKLLILSINNLIQTGVISENFIENTKTLPLCDIEEDLETLKSSINWKNHILNLKNRVQKLFESKDLSWREKTKLKRILTTYKDIPIDYEYLKCEFPGKSQSTLEKACNQIIELKVLKKILRPNLN